MVKCNRLWLKHFILNDDKMKGQAKKKRSIDFDIFSNLFFSLGQLITFFFSKKRKGQAFTVFKMMIAAAFAMALLALIYSSLSNVNCPAPAFNELKSMILDASRISGDCIVREGVCFNKGEIITNGFYENTLNINNVEFDDNNIGFCESSGDKCLFESQIILPVSVKCTSHDDCTVYIASKTCP